MSTGTLAGPEQVDPVLDPVRSLADQAEHSRRIPADVVAGHELDGPQPRTGAITSLAARYPSTSTT
jgi:hypothetical protein